MPQVSADKPFPVDDVRRRFPTLATAGPFIFFDNAAGAQVPTRVLEAVADHLLSRNVQRGGPYRRSREVDAMLARARESVAAFVNARSADEIAFGLNATSFIRTLSLAIGRTLGSRSLNRASVPSCSLEGSRTRNGTSSRTSQGSESRTPPSR